MTSFSWFSVILTLSIVASVCCSPEVSLDKLSILCSSEAHTIFDTIHGLPPAGFKGVPGVNVSETGNPNITIISVELPLGVSVAFDFVRGDDSSIRVTLGEVTLNIDYPAITEFCESLADLNNLKNVLDRLNLSIFFRQCDKNQSEKSQLSEDLTEHSSAETGPIPISDAAKMKFFGMPRQWGHKDRNPPPKTSFQFCYNLIEGLFSRIHNVPTAQLMLIPGLTVSEISNGTSTTVSVTMLDFVTIQTVSNSDADNPHTYITLGDFGPIKATRSDVKTLCDAIEDPYYLLGFFADFQRFYNED